MNKYFTRENSRVRRGKKRELKKSKQVLYLATGFSAFSYFLYLKFDRRSALVLKIGTSFSYSIIKGSRNDQTTLFE